MEQRAPPLASSLARTPEELLRDLGAKDIAYLSKERMLQVTSLKKTLGLIHATDLKKFESMVAKAGITPAQFSGGLEILKRLEGSGVQIVSFPPQGIPVFTEENLKTALARNPAIINDVKKFYETVLKPIHGWFGGRV